LQFTYQALLFQYGKIPVYRTHTQPGKFFFQLTIKPVSCRMRGCGSQQCEDPFALSAQLVFLFGSLFQVEISNLIIVTIFNI
jgi:hypothetical protein